MSSFIGIDLGTTFSAVATLDKTGRPVIIDNPDEQKSPVKNITSSCVRLNGGKFDISNKTASICF